LGEKLKGARYYYSSPGAKNLIPGLKSRGLEKKQTAKKQTAGKKQTVEKSTGTIDQPSWTVSRTTSSAVV
jgi:hypothetical protein